MRGPEPTGPAPDREDTDRAVTRLYAEHEAVETSLLALQDHAGRRLLEGARLSGVTESRWEAVERLIARMWAYFEAYTEVVNRVREVRDRRRWPSAGDVAELKDLLNNPHVAVAAAPDGSMTADASSPTAPPGTAASTATTTGTTSRTRQATGTETLTLTEAVRRISVWHARALDTVVGAESVWSALPARIDLLTAELQRTRALAHSVGVRPGEHPAGDELERVADDLTALRAEVVADPLAFWVPASGSAAPGGGRPDTARYDRAALAIEDVRREVEAVLDVRQDAEQRLSQVRDVLHRAERTFAEAKQARGEVLAKIAASEVPAVSGPPAALSEQVAAAADYRRRAQWHRLSPLLDRLEERAEDELHRARESLTAVTAPLAVRAELRGRLDATRARVVRAGLDDDPLLTDRYDTARRMLWSAPCDLRAAERAVLRYRSAAAEALVPRQAGSRETAASVDGAEGGTGR